jgi:hypothetical protein
MQRYKAEEAQRSTSPTLQVLWPCAPAQTHPSRTFLAQLSASLYGPAQTHPHVTSGGPLCIQRAARHHRRVTRDRRERVGKTWGACHINSTTTTTIERYPIHLRQNIPPAAAAMGIAVVAPVAAASSYLGAPPRAAGRRGEGAGPRPSRGGRDVLEGVLLRRVRARGGGRLDSRAAEENGLGGRRGARVQVPVRARGARARGNRRRRRAGVRAQAAPRDRPQHRQDRQELPAGENRSVNCNGSS